ncbi:hypothetical protein [Streptococcus lutetiensis]|nr:hypothetical protein [Streptococcus lutetiensis]
MSNHFSLVVTIQEKLEHSLIRKAIIIELLYSRCDFIGNEL